MFERIVEFEPAFDKRDSDPTKDYGIHGVTLRMVLKGPEGAVQFVLYTNWQLPHVTAEMKEAGDKPDVLYRPLPADLGYHSPKPMYEGQHPIGSMDYSLKGWDMKDLSTIPEAKPTGAFTPCEYLDGKPCYYDGSGLNAERIFHVLLKEGSNGVWRELEEYYKQTFMEAEIADNPEE